MKKELFAIGICGVITIGFADLAQSTLIDRGAGLLYDDVLDVTWLQDANYAKTSLYDDDGRMSFSEAKSWADQLVYHDSLRNVDYSDWRLAKNLSIEPPFHFGWWYANYDTNPSGGSHSELSYMYYVNLNLNGFYNTYGAWQNNFGIFGNGTFYGQKDVGIVKNLQGDEYWIDYDWWRVDNDRWTFETNAGDHMVRGGDFYAWAIRDGDVAATTPAPIPEPATMLLMGTGLAGLAVAKRRKMLV